MGARGKARERAAPGTGLRPPVVELYRGVSQSSRGIKTLLNVLMFRRGSEAVETACCAMAANAAGVTVPDELGLRLSRQLRAWRTYCGVSTMPRIW